MTKLYSDSVRNTEAKYMSNLAKEKFREYVDSDNFISQSKMDLAFEELMEDFKSKGKTITPSQEESLRKSMYSNLKKAFVRELFEAFTEYQYEINRADKSPNFSRAVSQLYEKYCVEPTNGFESNSDAINEKAKSNEKKQSFVGAIKIISEQYRTRKLISAQIGALAQKYGPEEFCDYIDRAAPLFGMGGYEVDGMKRFITGEDDSDFIFTRYTSFAHRVIIGLYQIYKSDNYNDLISKDDDGIIRLDDYKYVRSHRKAESMNMVGSWVIGSNLDAFYSTSPATKFTTKQRLALLLQDAQKNCASENEGERKPKEVVEERITEISRIAKKIQKILETPVNEGLTTIDQLPKEDLKAYREDLKEAISSDDMSVEEQKEVLKAIDEATPTTTSDEMIQEMIDVMNDPNVDISPSQILAILISESEDELKAKKESRKQQVDYLVSSLMSKICEVTGITSDEEKLRVFMSFNEEIQSTVPKIKEKNSFLIPQLAKQVGIDATVYYKATDSSRTNGSESTETIDSIMEVLKETGLIDDTTMYLSKTLLKPDEVLILGKEFMPQTQNGRVRMATLLESTGKFIKSQYAEKGLPKKEAEETVKQVRQGLIKQSLFNKMINFTNESNDSWGLIQDTTGRLRLAPKFVYEPSTDSVMGNNVRRVVSETKDNIMDFLLVYSKEGWFREWIDNAVVNLDFDKACQDMTRMTGVTLNRPESEYYRQEIFERMHSFVVNASEVGYNPEKIKNEWISRVTTAQRLRRGVQTIQSKVLSKKRKVSDSIHNLKKKKNSDGR